MSIFQGSFDFLGALAVLRKLQLQGCMRFMQCNLHIFAQVTYALVVVTEHFVQLGLHSHSQLMLLLQSFVYIVNLNSHICQNLL